MSIPLDRLYNYIDDMSRQIRGGPVGVYRFYPHGSKKIQDLTSLNVMSEEEFFTSPEIYCNDQEPLNYDLYTTGSAPRFPTPEVLETLTRKGIEFPRLNFRGHAITIWDRAILLHSEARSTQVEQYRSSQFIPAYYWCHAVIALDWFRYAQHVVQHKQVSKTFLIYNESKQLLNIFKQANKLGLFFNDKELIHKVSDVGILQLPEREPVIKK